MDIHGKAELRRNHYTRRANLRSIIQDGFDDMPPSVFEGQYIL